MRRTREKRGVSPLFSFVRPPGVGTRKGLQRAAAGAVPPLWDACGEKAARDRDFRVTGQERRKKLKQIADNKHAPGETPGAVAYEVKSEDLRSVSGADTDRTGTLNGDGPMLHVSTHNYFDIASSRNGNVNARGQGQHITLLEFGDGIVSQFISLSVNNNATFALVVNGQGIGALAAVLSWATLIAAASSSA